MKGMYQTEETLMQQSFDKCKDGLFQAKYRFFDFFVRIITTTFVSFFLQAHAFNRIRSYHYHLFDSRKNNLIPKNRIIFLLRSFITT